MKVVFLAGFFLCSSVAMAVSQRDIDDQLVTDAMWVRHSDSLAAEGSLEKAPILPSGGLQ